MEANTTTNTTIAAAIKAANHGRRKRTIDLDDIKATIADALASRSGIGWHRETVAKSYNYKATSAAAVAVVLGDKVALHVGSCDAKENSSVTTWATGIAKNAPQQPAYFHVAGVDAKPKHPTLWLSMDEAKKLAES